MARAMCDANWDATTAAETAFGEAPEEMRAYWLNQALVALEAMRDPSFNVCTAGPPRLMAVMSYCDVRDLWRSMLDAAITEELRTER